MTQYSEMRFDDLSLAERAVVIGGVQHTLSEATEGVACHYRNAVMRSAKMSDGKVVGTEGVADVQPLLVSLCLKDATGKPVPLPTVKSWPSRVVKPMYDWIREVSQLEEGESAERKAVIVALSRDDSPVTLDAVRVWAKTLKEEQFTPFVRLVEEQPNLKN